ncbi:MAG: hypothetical protein WCL08_00345 [Verrucomicrobiota bacterium]
MTFASEITNGIGSPSGGGLPFTWVAADFHSAYVNALANDVGLVNANYRATAIGNVQAVTEKRRSDEYPAAVVKGRYAWAVISATCYFKVWWDEVAYTDTEYAGGSGIPDTHVETGRTSRSWEPTFPSIAGKCIPADWAYGSLKPLEAGNPYDYAGNLAAGATPPLLIPYGSVESGQYTLGYPAEPPAPTGSVSRIANFVQVEKVRWSFVPGYTPPSDGSANGFPL